MPSRWAGINRLANNPRTANVKIALRTNRSPTGRAKPNRFNWSRVIAIPPKLVPCNMAPYVPASMMPFPVISCSSFKISGKILYLTGPKKADCVPIKHNIKKSKYTLYVKKPMPASNTINTSKPGVVCADIEER